MSLAMMKATMTTISSKNREVGSRRRAGARIHPSLVWAK